MIQKSELRKIYLEKRKAIPQERRKDAAQKAYHALKSLGSLLSFTPFGSEIDLNPLNEHLKAEGKLFLVPYEIEALFHVPFSQIDCILVPGLIFDKNHYRVGYGKGYYDRFLATAKEIPTIGVGFQEQFFEESLPVDPWDVPVHKMMLF